MIRFPRRFLVLFLALLPLVSLAPGCSENYGPSLSMLTPYPGAAAREAEAGSGFAGLVGGSLQQYTTPDAYEEVVDFYRASLRRERPQVNEIDNELGRQITFMMPQEHGMITVTIQDYEEEDTHITFMGVGS